MLKKRVTGIASAALIFAFTAPAMADHVCLQAYRIRNTTVVDPHTVLFHMNDGTVWRNTLKSACPGLLWHGFAYNLRGEDAVCDNEVPIRVVESGQVCMLGKFTPAGHS